MTSVETLLRQQRRVVAGALLLVAALAWWYTLAGVGMGMSAFEMTRHAAMPMPENAGVSSVSWTLGQALAMLAMWWVMMVAMMLPSAAPTILLAAALNQRSEAASPPYGSAGYFTAGYLLAWLFFSALAVTAQWGLQHSVQLSALLRSDNDPLTGALLITAGLWQFTPLKLACLRHCRSPVEFLTRHRRPGNAGALEMGLRHGAYCLGCCWFLMTLLFVGGVMNVYWIAGLALYVLAEKLLPYGIPVARLTGAALLLAGLSVLMV